MDLKALESVEDLSMQRSSMFVYKLTLKKNWQIYFYQFIFKE